jgi:hypothetical protein
VAAGLVYRKERPSASASLRFSPLASGVWYLPGMYQRNRRPTGLRWQMHSGGHPHFEPVGLCSRAIRVRDTPAFYVDLVKEGFTEPGGEGRAAMSRRVERADHRKAEKPRTPNLSPPVPTIG